MRAGADGSCGLAPESALRTVRPVVKPGRPVIGCELIGAREWPYPQGCGNQGGTANVHSSLKPKIFGFRDFSFASQKKNQIIAISLAARAATAKYGYVEDFRHGRSENQRRDHESPRQAVIL